MRLATLASGTTEEATLATLNNSLEEFRKSEKELRERLFVIQVAKKYDWEAANKMARRKAGEFNDPELAKVLEEREKRDEKAKKEKARLSMSFKAKRSGRYYGAISNFRGGYQGYQGYGPGPSTMTSQSSQDLGSARRGSFFAQSQNQGFRFGGRPARGEEKCHNCQQTGHFIKFCPNRK